MFGLLRNKISGFIGSLTGREQKKAEPRQQEKQETPLQAPVPEQQVPLSQKKQPPAKEIVEAGPIEIARPSPSPAGPPKKAEEKTPPGPSVEQKTPAKPAAAKVAEEKKSAPIPLGVVKKAEEKATAAPGEVKKSVPISPAHVEKAEERRPPAPSPEPEPDFARLEKRAASEKRAMAPKMGLGTAIKSFFSNEITIGESEVSDLLEELELSLLEADVAYDVSLAVSSQLKAQLVGMRVPKGELERRTRETVGRVLESVMDSDRKFEFVPRIKSLPRPVKVLFVGPNGAGKTTTMAKVARMLLDSGLTVVFSASDTFRAAAIEQTEVHAGRLGVKAIKSKYGADPASVAFDAVNFARANGVDVVLIDSAGRQDTNANLLSELVKINRVARPDLKIYVGESIGGNAVIDQIRSFNQAIGMDGAILTKIDCDAKGGTAISIAKSTGIPVLFLGVGQGYNDLVPFDPKKIAREIMS